MTVKLTNVFADVSSNNGPINLVTYRAAGHCLIAIKATEGTGYENPYYAKWVAECKNMSIIHYHFADLTGTPEAEAAHFVTVANPLTGPHDYLAVDIERAALAGWQADPAWCAAFDKYVQAHTRFFTILYASASTLKQSDQWLDSPKKRVWDADWTGSDPDYAPPGYQCVIRQRSGGAESLPGIGRCDVNEARGQFWTDVKAAHNAKK